MKLSIIFTWTLLLVVLGVQDSPCGMPSIPVRVGGTIAVDGQRVENGLQDKFVVSITKQDGGAIPAAIDENGLSEAGWWYVDVPVTGDIKSSSTTTYHILHVTKNGERLKITSPAGGRIQLGQPGSLVRVDLNVSEYDGQMQ